MKTIKMTYRKRFDNSCYHHQCIANVSNRLQYVVCIAFIDRDCHYKAI